MLKRNLASDPWPMILVKLLIRGIFKPLRRIAIGSYRVENALAPDQIIENLNDYNPG